jgi:uncharacterized protein (TIGR00290 family)
MDQGSPAASATQGPAAEPVALSWSGGKDSALALATLRGEASINRGPHPGVEVVALLTSVTRGYDRVSIHGVRRALLEAQARAVGVPLYEVTLEPECTNEAYEAAFRAAAAGLRAAHPALRRIAFGDLFLADVRAYREQLLARLGWDPVFPLWGRDTSQLARGFVDQGYRAILTCVDTTQLGAEFCGREFDAELLADLPTTVDPCGERGEFHTCVYAGPIFRRPLRLQRGERVRRDDRFEYCDLTLTAAGVSAA